MDYTLVTIRVAARSFSWRPGITYLLLLSYFALFGFVLGATGVLWDSFQERLRLSDGVFGNALLVTPLTGAGMLLALRPLTT